MWIRDKKLLINQNQYSSYLLGDDNMSTFRNPKTTFEFVFNNLKVAQGVPKCF